MTSEIDQPRRAVRNAPELGVVVGICFFLIGAQLPYSDACIGMDFSCPERWIDLTAGHTSRDSVEVVVISYGRLAPLLVAAGLILRSRENRRFAAGFIAFVAGILVARYFQTVAPQLLLAGSWEPGAALWPLGAVVMLISAGAVNRTRLDPGRASFTLGWRPALIVTMAGIGLIVAGLTIDVDAATSSIPWARPRLSQLTSRCARSQGRPTRPRRPCAGHGG